MLLKIWMRKQKNFKPERLVFGDADNIDPELKWPII
jgi:hypothetical protein